MAANIATNPNTNPTTNILVLPPYHPLALIVVLLQHWMDGLECRSLVVTNPHAELRPFPRIAIPMNFIASSLEN